ncbi:MAG: hypothetical protein WC600_13065 [Desulfobaccales bacterium]
MSDKTFFIDEYFKQWEKNVEKANELIENQRYLLEGILVLSCYLGAFAALRFPTLRDGEAYVKIVLEYSDIREFFEKIDLLFFYQWPRSKLRENGNYKALKQHSEIVEALKLCYGTEDKIKAGTRYVSPAKFIENVVAAAIPGFDEQNLRDKLPLFSLAELLYRYVRCDAVHNYDFPLINEGRNGNGNVIYEDNHAINGKVLLETTRSVIKALWEECRDKDKWPFEM